MGRSSYWRTSARREGPYLVISGYPKGTTQDQIERALDAAHAVFDAAGYDPVQVDMRDTGDPFEAEMFARLWDDAERAATLAAWAPRPGQPEATRIMIYRE